ncbi:putative 2,4-dienoyl-CoA reductase [Nocardioides dokdonensis FR1436]|uniref:Putative 2,4-dienoyl-CoA reductase n=1 Tax=Nocardioides dokdonensis FR1436 TaxID=1300347 RepID=A0A1A9GIV5_9ACTN|nr:SDR family oxidoreductase [Nocardioides dokdonensis]ANH38247.1 putative 2,4-dienoyl-CoA reductase [Nocardioides dokdonensis FR1436]
MTSTTPTPMTGPRTDPRFAGRVALVTGGGSGIGRAIALAYAAGGGTAVALGRRSEAVQETARLAEAAGGAGDWISCDVRDADALTAAVDQVVERHGRIDVLVNNAAGNFVVDGEDLSPNGWRAVIDIVLNGTFFATRAAGQHMLRAGSGSILNVIASYAWHGHPGTVHSAAAKAGVLAMTRTLAVEWADRGVRLNCLAPGPTETEGAGAALWATEEARAGVLGSVPMGRFTTPEEVAGTAAFLLSDEAAYVTGEVLTVDGGQWLGKQIYGRTDS